MSQRVNMTQVSEIAFRHLRFLSAQLFFHPIDANREHCNKVLYEEFGYVSDEDDCKDDFQLDGSWVCSYNNQWPKCCPI
jgi:hypothetical protein